MPSITADLPALRSAPHVTGAELDGTSLTLSFEGGVTYNVVLPDDYPRGEPLLMIDCDMEPLHPGTLEAIAGQLWGRAVRESARRAPPADDDEDGSVGYGHDDDEEEDEDDMMTPQMSSEIWQREESTVLSSKMVRDVEAATAAFGAGTADTRVLDDTTRLSVHVPLRGIIDGPTAKAFGAEMMPITIQMKFHTALYTEQSRPPPLEVTQNGEKFALGQQINAFLGPYLEHRWKANGWGPLPVQRGAAHEPRTAAATGTPPPAAKTGMMRSLLNAAQTALSKQLIDMGFTKQAADSAASRHSDLDEGVAYILEHDNNPPPPKPSAEAPTPAEDPDAASPVQEDRLTRMFKGKTSENSYCPDTDPKKLVMYDEARGFLCHLIEYVQKRVRTVCDFCVNCDKPHVWAGTMLRPSVCSRDVCVFAFQELNVGSDAAEGVAIQGGIVDLLVNIFKAAVKSGRAESILDPFPHVFDPDNRDKAVLDPKHKDMSKLREIVNNFPSLQHVVGTESLSSLRLQMEKKHRLAFPLLSWVISSNRSLLMKMDEAHRMSRMATKHQFMLVMAPPEKQAAFDEAKKKHGTKYAFHGSSIENWHAILRNGLRNCSGTKLQVNGAAHGSGIYFAKDAGTSIGYCRGSLSGGGGDGKNVGDLIDSENIVCLALCEIVSNAIKDHGWCWTVADETKVMTRFFFVFSDSATSQRASGVNTEDKTFAAEIAQLQDYYGVK